MYAIATLVMGGNKYVDAAIALAKSCILHIKQYHSDVELICMITDDVSMYDDLLLYYDYVISVDRISTYNIPALGNNASKIYPWVHDACTKWNILGITCYDKILFLDADMIVLDDIYNLFSLPTPAGSFDHPSAREYVSDYRWTGDRKKGTGFTNWYRSFSKHKLLHGSPIPPSSIDNLRRHSNTQFALQGGIVLLSPSKDSLDQFINHLPNIIDSLCMRDKNSKYVSYVHADRTLSAIDELSILLFYHDLGYTWTHIDHIYDVAAYHTYAIIGKDSKIIHYMGRYKPWDSNEREFIAIKSTNSTNTAYKTHHDVVEQWWNIYEMNI